jgi:hypothetical protein
MRGSRYCSPPATLFRFLHDALFQGDRRFIILPSKVRESY